MLHLQKELKTPLFYFEIKPLLPRLFMLGSGWGGEADGLVQRSWASLPLCSPLLRRNCVGFLNNKALLSAQGMEEAEGSMQSTNLSCLTLSLPTAAQITVTFLVGNTDSISGSSCPDLLNEEGSAGDLKQPELSCSPFLLPSQDAFPPQ